MCKNMIVTTQSPFSCICDCPFTLRYYSHGFPYTLPSEKRVIQLS